jgi:hypothetical protein
MKKIFLGCGCCMIMLPAFGQMVAKTSGLTIKSGTIFYNQGLVLTPSSDLLLSNDTVLVSNTPVTNPSGNSSIARIINISPAINFSGTAGIKYKAAELNGNTEGILSVALNNGNTGNNFTTMTSLDSASGSYYVYTPGLNSVSMGKVTAINNNVTLPIAMNDFVAKPLPNCAVALHWTADKADATNFSIERSADGRTWMQQNGTITMAAHAFSWIDTKPLSGINIYRLVLQLPGEKPEYSNPVQANNVCDIAASISVYPNPASEYITVKVNGAIAGTARLTVYNFNGKIMETIMVQQIETTVPLGKMATGSYILQYRDDLKTQNIKFSKM